MRNDGGDVVYSQKELTNRRQSWRFYCQTADRVGGLLLASVLNTAYTASDGKTYLVAFYNLDWNGEDWNGEEPYLRW